MNVECKAVLAKLPPSDDNAPPSGMFMVEFRTGGVGVLDASTGKSSDSDDCERVSKLSIGLIGFISISSFECISVCCGRPAERDNGKRIYRS